jgi:hypothetical protein
MRRDDVEFVARSVFAQCIADLFKTKLNGRPGDAPNDFAYFPSDEESDVAATVPFISGFGVHVRRFFWQLRRETSAYLGTSRARH